LLGKDEYKNTAFMHYYVP